LSKNRKLLAYHLGDLRVPPVVRVPQIGNPCFNRYHNVAWSKSRRSVHSLWESKTPTVML